MLLEGAWAPPQKKIIFVPKMISLGAFFRSVLPAEKKTRRRSLGTRILRFSHETELAKTVQKIIQNSMIRPGGGRTIAHPPKYATA